MDNRRLTSRLSGTVLLLLVLALVSAASGCLSTNGGPAGDTSPSVNVVCNQPYIVDGSECCLDRNSNSLCDNQESTPPPPPPQTTTAPATHPPQTQPPTTLPETTSTTSPTTTELSTSTTAESSTTTSISTTTTTASTTTTTSAPTTTTTTTSSTTTNTYPADGIYPCSQGPAGYEFPHGICQNDCPQGLECEPLTCTCQ